MESKSIRLAALPSRRSLLKNSCLGFGWLALHQLLSEEIDGSDDLVPARSIVMLTMVGGPSQMDLFDEKKMLARLDGKEQDTNFETLQPGSETKKLMGSRFAFSRHGQCGMQFSSLLPHLASVSDELTQIRSMFTANNNHPQAQRFLQSGRTAPGWPTFGSWISYALGSENANMPAYVVLRDPTGYTDGGSNHWTSGWLPAIHGGVEIRSEGAAVLNLHPTREIPAEVRRRNVNLIRTLNRHRQSLYSWDSRLESRIRNYELAARMQVSAERILDVSVETEATHKLYGLGNPVTADFGRRCLMARRMVEAGIRFVQVMTPISYGNSPFDSHSNLKDGLEKICPKVDQPSAALIRDLKQRGLLESTIVIWGGEFGRLPISQNGNGRDHNRNAFTLLLAGGGIRRGYIHGATDDLGYHAHNGRDERLTDPEVTGGGVVTELLA